MIRKFPSTEGDIIMLGTLVALGVCPTNDKKSFTRFASFECNRELVSYEVADDGLFNSLFNILGSNELNLGERDDLHYTKLNEGYQIVDKDGTDIF